VSDADIAWLLISTALVLFMVPGLSLFYGGLVAQRNVLTMMAESLAAIGVIGLLWVVIGYSLTFGSDHWGIIGSLDHLAFSGVGSAPSPWDPHIPAVLFATYQMMFAIITPALITGAFSERMHFRGYVLFIALWSVAVYAPVAHWVWGGGFLGVGRLGAVDFAGGAVVHETAGAAALATILYLGPRRCRERPHNLPMVLLGVGILWFGWFGFNAGSAGSAGSVAATAAANTQIAACAGLVAWTLLERARTGRRSASGMATGAVAGLAAITPACGYVPTWAALVIGGSAGVLCYAAVDAKRFFRYDDALDVIGVHMVGGVIGVLLTGVFARLAINAAGVAGGWDQLSRQALLVVICFAYPFFVTIALLGLVDKVAGLRVGPDEQRQGLDLGELGEMSYDFSDAPFVAAEKSLEAR
jgi:Amt family ammonium transporter